MKCFTSIYSLAVKTHPHCPDYPVSYHTALSEVEEIITRTRKEKRLCFQQAESESRTPQENAGKAGKAAIKDKNKLSSMRWQSKRKLKKYQIQAGGKLIEINREVQQIPRSASFIIFSFPNPRQDCKINHNVYR